MSRCPAGRWEGHVEVEWQFDAGDLGSIEGWLRDLSSASGPVAIPDRRSELVDVYFDTEDWRFYRAGYALRVRRDGESVEATMKCLTPAEDALRRRREISEPLEGGVEALRGTPGPVGDRLRALVGDRDLRPLFEVRTRRRVFKLHSAGEVALDESEIFGEAQILLSRVEVEVEPDTGLHAGVREFVKGMRDALGLRPAGLSKFELGLSAAGLNPPKAPDPGAGSSGEKDRW
jgi:inorganic triphosphatase YgiF